MDIDLGSLDFSTSRKGFHLKGTSAESLYFTAFYISPILSAIAEDPLDKSGGESYVPSYEAV